MSSITAGVHPLDHGQAAEGNKVLQFLATYVFSRDHKII